MPCIRQIPVRVERLDYSFQLSTDALAARCQVLKKNLIKKLAATSSIREYTGSEIFASGFVTIISYSQNLITHVCVYSQALMKKRQKLRIITKAKKIGGTVLNKAKDLERDLMNLALLPPEWIPEAFAILKERMQVHPALLEIVNPLHAYYESFWLKRVTPAVFSVYLKKQRTNNVIERYHRSLKELMATNPEILKFIGKRIVNIRIIPTV